MERELLYSSKAIVYLVNAHPHAQFVDALNKIWCYYEAFLGQTQMLNATPIRELANNFHGLTVRERNRHLLTISSFFFLSRLCMSKYWNTAESS